MDCNGPDAKSFKHDWCLSLDQVNTKQYIIHLRYFHAAYWIAQTIAPTSSCCKILHTSCVHIYWMTNMSVYYVPGALCCLHLVLSPSPQCLKHCILWLQQVDPGQVWWNLSGNILPNFPIHSFASRVSLIIINWWGCLLWMLQMHALRIRRESQAYFN